MILNVLFFIIKMVLVLFAEFVFFEGWGGKGEDRPIREGGLMVLAILVGLEWMFRPLL